MVFYTSVYLGFVALSGHNIKNINLHLKINEASMPYGADRTESVVHF